ncbi:hypothetical protein CaCOL14_011965 [Colletotrichum acutatum]
MTRKSVEVVVEGQKLTLRFGMQGTNGSGGHSDAGYAKTLLVNKTRQ